MSEALKDLPQDVHRLEKGFVLREGSLDAPSIAISRDDEHVYKLVLSKDNRSVIRFQSKHLSQLIWMLENIDSVDQDTEDE